MNPKTGLREPVSKSTLHRVVQSVDPEALEDVLGRYGKPRFPPRPGARRRRQAHSRRQPHRREPLRDRGPRRPRLRRTSFAARLHRCRRRTGGLARPSAAQRHPRHGDHRRRVAHGARKTATLITQTCGADYVFTVKGNAPETFDILDGIDWEKDATGHFTEDLDKCHGRLEQRSISVLTPLKGLINYPGISQIARVTRYREPLKKHGDDGAKASTETAYLITSLDATAAPPEDLLRLNRGHWAVENMNHRQRDCAFGEDACLTRTGHGPANRASLNTIALAVIFANRHKAESLADTRRRLYLSRSEAITALTTP